MFLIFLSHKFFFILNYFELILKLNVGLLKNADFYGFLKN